MPKADEDPIKDRGRTETTKRPPNIKHHVTFRKTPPCLHIVTPPISASSSPDNLSNQSPSWNSRPLRINNRLLRYPSEIMQNGGNAMGDKDESRSVGLPGGALGAKSGGVPRAVTASMTSMLSRRQYFGPDILIIVGIVLSIIGSIVTIIGIHVEIGNGPIHTLVMGIGPSLVAMGLLFGLLRLFFWRPSLPNCFKCCCEKRFRATVDVGLNGSDQSLTLAKRRINPADTAVLTDEARTGCGNVYGNRNTLNLDASVLMASCTVNSNLISSPASAGVTSPSNDLSVSRVGSKVNTPDDGHVTEASENEDNEITETLINCLKSSRSARGPGVSYEHQGLGRELPAHLWNIPLNISGVNRPRSAPTSVAACTPASYPVTPSDERSAVIGGTIYGRSDRLYFHTNDHRRSSLNTLPSVDCSASLMPFSHSYHPLQEIKRFELRNG